jgi:hypothetical protein
MLSKKSIFPILILGATVIVASAEGPDDGVEKACRFQAVQVEPPKTSPVGCDGSTEYGGPVDEFARIALEQSAAAAIVDADNPDSVERAERFQAPQPELELSVPHSCEAPAELSTEKLSLGELAQSQNASSQLEELGRRRCMFCWYYCYPFPC